MTFVVQILFPSWHILLGYQSNTKMVHLTSDLQSGPECFAVKATPKLSTSHLICNLGTNALLSKQHAVGSWKGSPLTSGGGFCGEFARLCIGSGRQPPRTQTWPSALLAVVFSACKKELATNICRPDTQNVAGHEEFIKDMGQE